MKDRIRRVLDEYEGRHERRDEELAAVVSRHVDAMGDRRLLKRYIAVLGVVNALIWLSAIIFPGDLREAWGKITDANDRIGAFVIAGVFGLGLWLTYSVIRLKYRDIEDQSLDSDLFGSVNYHARANKRFFVWLFSVVGGVVNIIALAIVVIALSSD